MVNPGQSIPGGVRSRDPVNNTPTTVPEGLNMNNPGLSNPGGVRSRDVDTSPLTRTPEGFNPNPFHPIPDGIPKPSP